VSLGPRLVAASAVALLALAGAGCDVRTEVTVDVEESGSGTVTVGVGLDADAVSRLPDLSELVRANDLEDAGWTISGPDRDDDDVTWFRAEKPFATPAEATAILGEISGPDGPFRGFSLERDRPFGRTELRLEGTVDLTSGLSAFSDAALAASLEGEPLGEPIEAIEQRLGAAAADVFRFRLVVRMPPVISSNAPHESESEAVWEPSLADPAPTEVLASTQVWRRGSIVALAVGVAALLLLLVWLTVRVVRHRRPDDSPLDPLPVSADDDSRQ
jgi:hypothetical protein